MICPFCGGEMQHGKFLFDGRTKSGWLEDTKKYSKLNIFPGQYKTLSSVHLSSPLPVLANMEGDFCPKCKKMIFDTNIIEP